MNVKSRQQMDIQMANPMATPMVIQMDTAQTQLLMDQTIHSGAQVEIRKQGEI